MMKHNVITMPPQPQLPVAFIADAIEALIDAGRRIDLAQLALIAVLDAATPDPDLEPDGDEADGNASEDDFMFHGHNGPGCPIADPDLEHDGREEEGR